jgi:hypothetical protein
MPSMTRGREPAHILCRDVTPLTLRCPRCHRPVFDVQHSPRGQVFHSHGDGKWCVTGVREEQVAA